MDADLFELKDEVTGDQTGRTRFGGLWVVDPVGPLRAVHVGKAAVEVDHLGSVGLQRNFFDVGHVETRCIVDGVDADGEGLVGKLFAVAGSQGDHRLTVHVVVNGLVAKRGTTEFDADEFRV